MEHHRTAYLWEDGQTSVFREAMPFGSYTVTITDANNCEEVIGFVLNLTTGIDDLAVINTLNLFPNPTTGITFLEIDLTESVNFSVEIFDLLGKRVLSHQNSKQDTERIPLNIQHLPNGTYFVQLFVNQHVISSKKLILID